MLRKLIQTLRTPWRKDRASEPTSPAPQGAIHIPRQAISRAAVHVVERLQTAGYEAYVVGGCVRDLLLGLSPKDYDVATNATPEQVRNEFRGARIIGRRFRLVHVRMGRELIEVATFRAHHEEDDDELTDAQSARNASGRLLRDNVFGSIEDDAQRRDFSINAFYYDPVKDEILDFNKGIADIQSRQLRLIGDPRQRYLEDPVRMLRAIRFAAKLDFALEPETAAPIRELAPLLRDIPSARLYDEAIKLFLSGQALRTFELLQEYGLFEPLFPQTAESLKRQPVYASKLIREALENTDIRVREGRPVTPAFLFAALLWPALPHRAALLRDKGVAAIPAFQEAAHDVVWQQCQRIAIPKRFTMPMREIWDMQERLPRRNGRRADQLLENPRFRAAYDFLLLRESAGERTNNLGDWWTAYQTANESQRREMIRQLPSKDGNKKPRRRRRSGAPSKGPQND